MIKAARNGPANGTRMKVYENASGGYPHSSRMKGITMIQENAYAIRKKKNKGCCRMTSRRLLEAAAG